MKVALCFIINYEHILNKEHIWREWIEYNKDIINVYFYYKDLKKIKSKWILEHTIPPNYIRETSYFHVIPAYISVMSFAFQHDRLNQWFCMLTDSCCPIISPKRFRYLFYKNYNKSIMNWRKAWWNCKFHKRANLEHLPEELRLANDPWFVLKREHIQCINFFVSNSLYKDIFKLICSGGLANESLFAIIFYILKQINNNNQDNLIPAVTHATDWSRMESTTSPHLFKYANDLDIKFINEIHKNNEYIMFIRKIAPEFPDITLKQYIYDKNKKDDDLLILEEPFIFKYNRIISYLNYFKYYIVFGLFIYVFYFNIM